MAQYRTGHPAAGWATLQQNLRLTWTEDPGAVTEVISGRFYQPLGRSSAHQLWSSAMTLAPAVRGLFGLDVDATRRTVRVHPKLPVQWDHAELDNVRIGPDLLHVSMTRAGAAMNVRFTSDRPSVLCLNPAGDVACATAAALTHVVSVRLPAVEAELHNPVAPHPGDETHLPRITDERYEADRVELSLEGQGGSTLEVDVRRKGVLSPIPMSVRMPDGAGFVRRQLVITAEENAQAEPRH